MDQPGKVANPARGQLNRENNVPLSPCVPENLVSRDGFIERERDRKTVSDTVPDDTHTPDTVPYDESHRIPDNDESQSSQRNVITVTIVRNGTTLQVITLL